MDGDTAATAGDTLSALGPMTPSGVTPVVVPLLRRGVTNLVSCSRRYATHLAFSF